MGKGEGQKRRGSKMEKGRSVERGVEGCKGWRGESVHSESLEHLLRTSSG